MFPPTLLPLCLSCWLQLPASSSRATSLLTLHELLSTRGQSLTYKSLSIAIAQPANAAKSILAEYVQKHAQEVNATYLLGGDRLQADGVSTHHELVIVPASELEATKRTFKQLTTYHVYSVQPKTNATSASCSSSSTSCDESSEEWRDFGRKLFQIDLTASLPFYNELDLMTANPLRDNRYSAVANTENIIRTKPVAVAANAVYVPAAPP
ncbi:MAG: hypothetical protein P4L81_03535, partial [Candidatus Pacebacteria bacterium]|nr:hypothetical protein [Candidatus Paceibacterota bacterium]